MSWVRDVGCRYEVQSPTYFWYSALLWCANIVSYWTVLYRDSICRILLVMLSRVFNVFTTWLCLNRRKWIHSCLLTTRQSNRTICCQLHALLFRGMEKIKWYRQGPWSFSRDFLYIYIYIAICIYCYCCWEPFWNLRLSTDNGSLYSN